MVGVVACSGALFEGDFLRERKPIVGVVREEMQARLSFCRQVKAVVVLMEKVRSAGRRR
jgi:hypothetical protein